jgi:hypothetical protein
MRYKAPAGQAFFKKKHNFVPPPTLHRRDDFPKGGELSKPKRDTYLKADFPNYGSTLKNSKVAARPNMTR